MSDGVSLLTILAIIAALGQFVLLLCWLSGWRQLSINSGLVNFNGHLIRGVSADTGPAAFKGMLEISVSARGIACRIPSWFAWWYKPIFLPWENLVTAYTGMWWLTPVLSLQFQVGTIKIRLRIAEEHKFAIDRFRGVQA